MKMKDLLDVIGSSHAKIRIYDREDHICKRIGDQSMIDMYSLNGVQCSELEIRYILSFHKDRNGVKRLDVWCKSGEL